MSNIYAKNIIRFILLVLVQVFILKRLSAGWAGEYHLNIFIYPLFLMLLPLRTPLPLLLILGFLLGISIDAFYDSMGIHASACVFMAYTRPRTLKWLAPRDGYNVKQNPTKDQFGWLWFLVYSGILLMVHLLFFFSIESFAPHFILTILLKTLISFFISMLFFIVVIFIFNPK